MTKKTIKQGATKAKEAKPAKVLIVDDHPAVREALMLRISRQKDLRVCGQAADLPTALCLVRQTRPDVAVIDIALANSNGIDLIKRIKARDKSVRMLVWSMYNESLYAERALRAGALGYITKEQATQRILDAIRCVAANKIFLTPELSENILRRSLGGHKELGGAPADSLSDRELEAFSLFGQGLTTQDVAVKMHISKKTVETYRVRIKEKLGVHSANEVVQRAAQWLFEEGKGN